MRCRGAQPILAIACLYLCLPSAGAQSLTPNPDHQNVNGCAPASIGRQPSEPKVTIADLYFEGDLGMPPADVEQVASALKQQTYSGEPDEVVDEVLERARRAWQDHGYFKPSSLQVASPDSRIDEQIDEQAGTVAITFDYRPCPLQP